MTQDIQPEHVAFIDECGDHSMDAIDPDFPIFVLAMVVVRRATYLGSIIPQISKLKLRFWDHEGVNLHSRDIRKATGDFDFMMHPELRKQMYEEIEQLMSADFTLFITAIHKQRHKERYGTNAHNPYDVALKFTLERVIHYMRDNGISTLPITAEARGKKEDDQLAAGFFNLTSNGTEYISSTEIAQFRFPLKFRKKSQNIAGLQVADLCAYPYARKLLSPLKESQPVEILSKRIYSGARLKGLKYFP